MEEAKRERRSETKTKREANMRKGIDDCQHADAKMEKKGGRKGLQKSQTKKI